MVQVPQCSLLLCVAVLGDTSVWPVDHSQFSVVEAVPDDNLHAEESVADVAVNNVIQSEKIKYMEHEYIIEEEDIITPSPTKVDDIPVTVGGRRFFRSCHGKCVQKTCLPVLKISVYTTCVENCRESCL